MNIISEEDTTIYKQAIDDVLDILWGVMEG